MNVLVVAALEQELDASWGPVLHTGIGKVNAAVALAHALYTGPKPDLVVNVGTAGSTLYTKGEVVVCNHFTQHDFDLGPLAHLFPPSAEYTTDLTALGLGQYGGETCHSGDHFVTEGHHWSVVDMEAYALAAVCHKARVPFLALKYISDGANPDGAHEWQQTVPKASEALKQTLHAVLGSEKLP